MRECITLILYSNNAFVWVAGFCVGLLCSFDLIFQPGVRHNKPEITNRTEPRQASNKNPVRISTSGLRTFNYRRQRLTGSPADKHGQTSSSQPVSFQGIMHDRC